MKVVLFIAPLAILVLWITPTFSLVYTWIQWSIQWVFLDWLFTTLVFILIFILLVVVARTRCRIITQPLYYLLGSLVFACSVSYGYRALYSILTLVWSQSFLYSPWIQWIFVAIRIGLVWFSVYNFEKDTTVRTITISSQHVDRPISFVYLADIQFGSTNKRFLNKTIALVNSLNPEFILFGWDLVDFDHYEESDFEIFNTLQVPMYFITGNHEYYHQAQRILSYIQHFPNIILLDNKKILTKSWIEVIGVDYRHAKSHPEYESILDSLMPSEDRFSAFMFHEPKRVESTALRWYDLQLYGHTHGGQIFPWNLLSRTVYGKFAYWLSLLEKTNTRVYTTFGAGLWGPRMRLGSENEVVVFTVEPK
jgi:hypothetical protein